MLEDGKEFELNASAENHIKLGIITAIKDALLVLENGFKSSTFANNNKLDLTTSIKDALLSLEKYFKSNESAHNNVLNFIATIEEACSILGKWIELDEPAENNNKLDLITEIKDALSFLKPKLKSNQLAVSNDELDLITTIKEALSLSRTATVLNNNLSAVYRFMQPMLDYLVGDMPQLITGCQVSKEMAPGILDSNFGLLGHCYEINPNPDDAKGQEEFRYTIGPLLNEFDKKSDGRAAYAALNKISGGSQLLGDTSLHSVAMRKIIIRYFGNLQKFVDCMHEEVAKMALKAANDPINIMKMIRCIMYKVMAKVFFGLDELPPNTLKNIKALTNTAFGPVSSMFPTLSSLFDSKFKNTKKQFHQYSKLFLEGQIQIVMDLLQSDSVEKPGKNIVLDVLLYIIKEENPHFKNNADKLKKYLRSLDEQEIIHYFESDLITALPSSFMVVDNISKAIEFYIRNGLIDQQQDIFKSYLSTNKEQEALSTRILMEMEILDKAYVCALNMPDQISISRYSTDMTQLEDRKNNNYITFKPNSFFIFNLKKYREVVEKKPEYSGSKYFMFSPKEHHRTCPGFKVAEVLFKSFICELVSQHEIFLVDFDGGSNYQTDPHCYRKLKLTTRKNEEKEQKQSSIAQYICKSI